MIRPKLMLAFFAMAVMTGFCGAVGYLFVDRIGRSVSVFSEVTSPLLAESVALADDAQYMRTTFLLAIQNTEPAEDVSRKLATLYVDARARLERLRALAAPTGVDLSLDTLQQGGERFATLLDNILLAHQRELAAIAVTKQIGRAHV